MSLRTVGSRTKVCLRGGLSAFAIAAVGFSAQSASAQDAEDQVVSDAGEPVLEAGSLPVPSPPPGSELPPVEEIVSDDEFNSSIPELGDDDPELMQDLESIEEFERRFAEENAGDDADAVTDVAADTPLGLPELADLSLIHI